VATHRTRSHPDPSPEGASSTEIER
jgi:hypothetical protein